MKSLMSRLKAELPQRHQGLMLQQPRHRSGLAPHRSGGGLRRGANEETSEEGRQRMAKEGLPALRRSETGRSDNEVLEGLAWLGILIFQDGRRIARSTNTCF